jgi:hypothetical protein
MIQSIGESEHKMIANRLSAANQSALSIPPIMRVRNGRFVNRNEVKSTDLGARSVPAVLTNRWSGPFVSIRYGHCANNPYWMSHN